MIQFEIGSPTVIKAQGVTQTTFNKKIKKLAMQKKTVACEKTDFTGWSDGGKNEWKEISTHTMHKDTFLDKLTQTSQTKEKTICFSKGGKYFKEPSGLHWVILIKTQIENQQIILQFAMLIVNFVTLKIKNLMITKRNMMHI